LDDGMAQRIGELRLCIEIHAQRLLARRHVNEQISPAPPARVGGEGLPQIVDVRSRIEDDDVAARALHGGAWWQRARCPSRDRRADRLAVLVRARRGVLVEDGLHGWAACADVLRTQLRFLRSRISAKTSQSFLSFMLSRSRMAGTSGRRKGLV